MRAKLLLLAITVLPLLAETTLPISQVRPGPEDCIFLTYQGLTGCLPFEGLEIVLIDGKLTLRPIGGGAAAPSWIDRIEVVANQQASWVLLNPIVPGSLTITHAGQTLSLGEDYTLSGQTVTFLGVHVPQVDDVVRFHYQTPP